MTGINHLAISRLLALTTSIAITYGAYDQAVKIWKTKSVREISFSLVVAWIFNEITWLYYGIAIQEWLIIVLSVVNLPAAMIGAAGYWRYRK